MADMFIAYIVIVSYSHTICHTICLLYVYYVIPSPTESVSRVEDDLLQQVDSVQTKLLRGPKSDRLEARKSQQFTGEIRQCFGLEALPTSALQAFRVAFRVALPFESNGSHIDPIDIV